MTDTPPVPPPPRPATPLHALVTAGVLLALYVGLTLAMMGYFAHDEGKLWEHALLIYNGFTAFAVAAGGVLLGTQIQQANVTAARREADSAKSEADRVKQAAREALAAAHADPTPGAAANLADIRARLARVL